MGIAILLGVVGLVALLAATGEAKAAPGAPPGPLPVPPPPPADLPPVTPTPPEPNKPTATIKGASGTTWITQVVGTDKVPAQTSGGGITGDLPIRVGTAVVMMPRMFVDVFLPKGEKGSTRDFRVVRFSQIGTDTANRMFVESPAGVSKAILELAMSDFSIRRAAPVAPPPVPGRTIPPSAIPIPPGISDMLRDKLAAALKALTVDANGRVVGPVTKGAVQLATSIAGDLERAGFPEAAAALRGYAQAASALIPAPPPEQRLPLPPSIPPILQEMINRAIQMERDPAKLKAIVDALKRLPQSKERDAAIGTIEAIIVQEVARRKTEDALKDVEDIIKAPPVPIAPPIVIMPAPPPPAPGIPPQNTYVVQSGDTGEKVAQKFTGDKSRWRELLIYNPKLKSAKYGIALYTGKTIILPPDWKVQPAPAPLPDRPAALPPSPTPQPLPAPMSPVEQAAAAMAANLLSLQKSFGMPGAKYKEDKGLVTRFQSMVGEKTDGMPGPGTTLKLALNGRVGNLPLVMYWPRSATASRVLQYRTDVRNVAAQARAAGDTSRAAALELSAQRERGQGGIVGSMPA